MNNNELKIEVVNLLKAILERLASIDEGISAN